MVIHQGKLRFYIRKNTKNAHHRFHPWYLPLRKPLIFKEKCQIIGRKYEFLVKLANDFVSLFLIYNGYHRIQFAAELCDLSIQLFKFL